MPILFLKVMVAVDHKNSESFFNMAFAYLGRIDRILTCCWYSSFNGDVHSWYKHLMALYREVSPKLSEEENAVVWGSKEDLTKPLNIECITNDNAKFIYVNRVMNSARMLVVHKKEIMQMLNLIEIKLRGCLQAKGMLLASKADPRYAILEGIGG